MDEVLFMNPGSTALFKQFSTNETPHCVGIFHKFLTLKCTSFTKNKGKVSNKQYVNKQIYRQK